MRIAVVGAGAIGSYYAALLARAGYDARLLARGEHLAALRRSELSVRTPDESFTVPLPASDDAAELAGAEYVLLTVKSYSLDEVAPALAQLARAGATIVPLLNGVDIDERLVALGVPRPRILPGLTTISVVRSAPGVVERRSPFQRVTVGELTADGADGASARATELGAAFDRAGVTTRVSPEIRLDLWRKFGFLEPIAAACGLRRAAIGEVRDSREGRHLVERAVREVFDVGAHAGVPWSGTDESETLGFIEAVAGSMKPSFLLDVERGGPTELDVLAGTVCRLGRELGVATPVHDEVVATLAPAAAR